MELYILIICLGHKKIICTRFHINKLILTITTRYSFLSQWAQFNTNASNRLTTIFIHHRAIHTTRQLFLRTR